MRFPIVCKKQTRLPNEGKIGSSSPLHFSLLMSRLGLKKDVANVAAMDWKVPEIRWSSSHKYCQKYFAFVHFMFLGICLIQWIEVVLCKIALLVHHTLHFYRVQFVQSIHMFTFPDQMYRVKGTLH